MFLYFYIYAFYSLKDWQTKYLQKDAHKWGDSAQTISDPYPPVPDIRTDICNYRVASSLKCTLLVVLSKSVPWRLEIIVNLVKFDIYKFQNLNNYFLIIYYLKGWHHCWKVLKLLKWDNDLKFYI